MKVKAKHTDVKPRRQVCELGIQITHTSAQTHEQIGDALLPLRRALRPWRQASGSPLISTVLYN